MDDEEYMKHIRHQGGGEDLSPENRKSIDIKIILLVGIMILMSFFILTFKISAIVGLLIIASTFIIGKKLKMPYTREQMDRSSIASRLILLALAVMGYIGMMLVVFR